MALLRCPAQFCECRSETCASCLNRMCTQMESLPLFIVFLSDKLWSILFFLRLVVSVISLELKQKINKGAGFPFVAWCMMNTVSKNNIHILELERGMGHGQATAVSAPWPAQLVGPTFQWTCKGTGQLPGCGGAGEPPPSVLWAQKDLLCHDMAPFVGRSSDACWTVVDLRGALSLSPTPRNTASFFVLFFFFAVPDKLHFFYCIQLSTDM